MDKGREIANKSLAVVIIKSAEAARLAARSAHLLLLMANEELHVYGLLAVQVPAYSYGEGSSSQHHAGKANVLGYHNIAGLQALDDGEVGGIRTYAHVERFNPKAPARGQGVSGVVAADAALQVLRTVSGDYGMDAVSPGGIERLARDGSCIGVDKQGGCKRGRGLHG